MNEPNGKTVLDPTPRTLEQLTTTVTALKELHEVRLDGMEKAIEVAHEDMVRVPTEVQKAVASLKELILEMFKTVDEKFTSVHEQFRERDVRSDKTAELNQKALDAALLTAEKAVSKQQESFAIATDKSETSFTKQIEALRDQLATIVKTGDDKVSDIRGQLARLDTAIASANGRTTGHGDTWGYIIGGVGILAAIMSLVIHFAK